MMSAPARLMAVRCSVATTSWSIQPLAAAALSIAYSPLTWYAASGTVDRGPHRGDDVEIGQRRLHHHHVGALGEVGLHLQQRLAARCARSCWYALRSPPPTMAQSTASRNGPYWPLAYFAE